MNMKDRAKALFNEAVKMVSEANEELCRPEEDVVTVLVCKKAQRASENFLRGFLLQNNMEPDMNMTLDALYQQCMDINPNFSLVDLTSFECRTLRLDSQQCNSLSKVKGCIKTASKLDNFLREEKVI